MDAPSANPNAEPSSGARVVIIGGGFGGLAAAKQLAKAPVEITLVDRQNHHCFQPLLYQVATASLSPADVAWPIRSILARQRNVRVVMGEVVAVDSKTAAVITASGHSYKYDFLVIATGATHSYFGHDSWAQIAPGLKRIEDAIDIRCRVLLGFEQAEIAESVEEASRLLTFVIVGGGPTGVELAGAIADTAKRSLASDFRRIDPKNARIILIEAGPRLLAAFPQALARYAETSLRNMGVDVLTRTSVTQLADGTVVTSTGTIAAYTVLWAAGVKASGAADWLHLQKDRAGRILVDANLSVPGFRNIFAIGDTANASATDGKPAPGIAPAAKQMGKYVGRVISHCVANTKDPGSFHYRHYGDLATIGRKAAVVSIGRFHLTGLPAWIFWSLAHIYYLIGARNRMIVAVDWIWDYVTFQRGARLINQPAAGAAATWQTLQNALEARLERPLRR